MEMLQFTRSFVIFVFLCLFPLLYSTRVRTNTINDEDVMNIVTFSCGHHNHLLSPFLMSLIQHHSTSLHLIHVTIFTDNDGKGWIQSCLQQMQSTISLEIHSLSDYHEPILEPYENTRFKCAIYKLFLYSMMPNIDKVLFIDVDTLILQNLTPLWMYFNLYPDKILMAALEVTNGTNGWYIQNNKQQYYPPSGFNTGVMLLNLKLLRIQNITVNTFIETNHEPILLADQDVFNSWAYFNQEKCQVIGCQWNKRGESACPDHSNYYYLIHDKGILHGNNGAFMRHLWKYFNIYREIFSTFCEYNKGRDITYIDTNATTSW